MNDHHTSVSQFMFIRITLNTRCLAITWRPVEMEIKIRGRGYYGCTSPTWGRRW